MRDLIMSLEEIDENITFQFNKLSELIDTMHFKVIAKFKTSEAADKIPWDNIVYQGLYFIEIKNDKRFNNFDNWLSDFKMRWEDEKYLKRFTPNIKKVRTSAHTELRDWIPIYIGKSKNIRSRIHGHIYKELHKTTFALKLKARENLNDEIFRISTIKIDVKNYESIVLRIESEFRNRINPIIGKQ